LTRFGHSFLEYRIRGVTFDINALSDVPGLTMFSISEDGFITPSYDRITSMTNWLVPNSSDNPRSHKLVRWRAIDLDNLNYRDTDSFGTEARSIGIQIPQLSQLLLTRLFSSFDRRCLWSFAELEISTNKAMQSAGFNWCPSKHPLSRTRVEDFITYVL
jgi:hypothetical protein